MRKLMIICAVSALALAACGGALAQSPTNWVEHPSNPIFDPAEKAYYPSVLYDGGTYKMWYAEVGGLRMTTSADGIAWGAGTACTGLTNANHPLVEKIGAEYRVWYWPGLSYSIADIRTATSADGITWVNDQAITQVGTSVVAPSGWNRGSYGPADVIYNAAGSVAITPPVDEASVWANKYVMYYDGTTGGDESLGLAVSADGILWQGYNGGVAPVFAGAGSGWDTNYVTRATIIKESATLYHMWYSGGTGSMNHGIGYASSSDGISWTRDAGNPIFHKDDGVAWRASRSYCPVVIGSEMWFSGKDGPGNYAIGYAYLPPTEVWVATTGNDSNPGTEASPFATIQKGINTVAEGGTVHVAAGTYPQRLSVSKPVGLRGAQYGVDPTAAGARTNPALESIITEAGLSTPNPDVLIEIGSGGAGAGIDGFTLNGDPTNPTADTSVVRCWADDVTISNNIVEGRLGVLYKGGDGLTVDNNTMVVNKNGVVAQPGATPNLTISDNVFSLGASPAGDESAIYMTASSHSDVTGNTATGFINGKGLTGSNNDHITVSGNTFTGNKDGVSLWGTTTFVTISGNNLSNMLRFGISIKGQDITITDNLIANNGDTGVNVDRHVIDTERVTINNNTISGNMNTGVKVNTALVTEIVDATLNWWGDATGPSGGLADPVTATLANGTGDAVSAGATFDPWIGKNALPSGEPSEVSVDDDWADLPDGTVVGDGKIIGFNAFGSIQDGIDAVSGSTVNVAAGLYTEYVHIIKDGLTLQGAGMNDTIIDLDGVTPYYHYAGVSTSYANRAGIIITPYGQTPADDTGGDTELIEDVAVKDLTVRNAGVNPPVTTGTHTGLDNVLVLEDIGASWVGDLSGQYLINASDYVDNSGGRQFSRWLITSNTPTTITATHVSGGDDQDWDNGDTYVISPYESWYDGALDGRDDVIGIRASSGKNITVENCKVENCGDRGISYGQARRTNAGTRPASENPTVIACKALSNHGGGIAVGGTTGTATITGNTVSYNSNPTTEGCMYSGVSPPDCHVTGMHIGGTSNSLLLGGTISGNTVRDNAYHGITIYRYTDGLTVENNTVTGHNLNWEGAGIFVSTGWGWSNTCKNHVIQNNTVTGNIRGIIGYFLENSSIIGNTVSTDSGTFDPGQAAIKIDYGNNLTVQDNVISCDGTGIRIRRSDSHTNSFTGNTIIGAEFAGIMIDSGAHDNTFTFNTISGTTSDTFTQYADWGTHDGGDGQTILTDSTQSWTVGALEGFTVINLTDESSGLITANTDMTVTAILATGTDNDWDDGDEYDIVYDETRAVGVYLRGGACYAAGHAGTGNVFHYNNIFGNGGDGMENQIATVVDAENNWWGSANGPSDPSGTLEMPENPGATVAQMLNAAPAGLLGDGVSDNVDYYPWLDGPGGNDVLWLNVPDDSLYVKPTETVTVEMKVRNLQQAILGAQAMLGYEADMLETSGGNIDGVGDWDVLSVTDVRDPGGEIDLIVGWDLAQDPGGSSDDATMATITFTPEQEGTTLVTFRPDGQNDTEQTLLADANAQAVYPAKTNSQTIVIDGTAPTFVEAYADPASWTNGNIDVIFSATDDNSGIDHYELKIDAGAYASPVTSPHTITAGSVSDGPHVVTVKAVDLAGNDQTATVDIYYDGTQPLAFTPTADPPSWTNAANISITFATTDATSGIDHYELDVDGGGYSTVTSPHSVSTAALSDGTHTVSVKAVDVAGNDRVGQVTIYTDKTAPLAFTPTADPASWTNAASIDITFSTTDATCNIDHYELDVDGGGYSTVTSVHSLPTAALSDDTHTVSVKAIDEAGNEQIGQVTVYTDKTDPAIAIDSATQDANDLLGGATALVGTVTIVVSASDVTSGLDGVPTVTVTPNGGSAEDISGTVVDNLNGTFTYTYEVTTGTPNGTATIDASVSDNAGNSNSAIDTFDINKNQFVATVQLEGLNPAAPFDRDVTFVATGGAGKTWQDVTLNFLAGSDTASTTLTDVPTGTTGLSAKTDWNLRSKVTPVDLGDGQGTAGFTGADKLLGGDLNDTNTVNILDWAVLRMHWFTTDPEADVNGDGQVSASDYNILVLNWFGIGDDE